MRTPRKLPAVFQLPPFYGEDLTTERPLTAKIFAIDAYRQRYLAHLRTILSESFHWDYFEPRIEAYGGLIESDVLADNIKETTNSEFLSSIDPDNSELREFIEARRTFLLNHPEVDHDTPVIVSAGLVGNEEPVSATPVMIQASIGAGPVVESMSLYYTSVRDGAFTRVVLEDKGDDSFEGEIPGMLAGSTVYYYVEAKADALLNICGHVHPVARLRQGCDGLRLPCFAFHASDQQLLIPAFGELTGGHECGQRYRKWLVADNAIVPWLDPLSHSPSRRLAR